MEVMVNVPAVANLIREGKTHQITTVMQTSRGLGMATFETATQDLINKGLISKEDGMSFLRRRSAAQQMSGSGNHTPRVTGSFAVN